MSEPRVSVVIPTLVAGPALVECLASLVRQSFRGFEILVIDNSGRQLAREAGANRFGAVILEQKENIGFGAAVNAGFRYSRAPLLATLNDDAVAHPDWLAQLVAAAEAHPRVGMFASQVVLSESGQLDSAGMLVCGDGTSKQRGHFEPPERYNRLEEVLLPSGSAALYRREMLDEIGMFDEDFYLYCEDTDLGLRARWAGWTCIYVPGARVDHGYSATAGRASPLKAYYVERNRLCVLLKNFPAGLLLRAPGETLARYVWHFVSILQNRGMAARFTEGNHGMLDLAFIVVRAHAAVAFRAWSIWKKRRALRRTARLTSAEFRALLEKHRIAAREVAVL
ncbi:MAG: glycosyltransferase family 2 protein [Rhodospirillales bacterium]